MKPRLRLVAYALVVAAVLPTRGAAQAGPLTDSVRYHASREQLSEAQTQSAPVARRGRPGRVRSLAPIFIGAGFGCYFLSWMAYSLEEGDQRGATALKGCLYGAAWGAGIGWIVSIR
jgi:hypothetical protein